MKKNVALKLEKTSGEFTFGVKYREFAYFWEHYDEVIKKLKDEDTCDEVLNVFYAKRDLCEAYMKVFNALDKLKE